MALFDTIFSNRHPEHAIPQPAEKRYAVASIPSCFAYSTHGVRMTDSSSACRPEATYCVNEPGYQP